jgi:hypothetical protein
LLFCGLTCNLVIVVLEKCGLPMFLVTFHSFMRLSSFVNHLPLIVMCQHCRDAQKEFTDIVSRHKGRYSSGVEEYFSIFIITIIIIIIIVI